MDSGTAVGSALQLPSPSDLQDKLERVWAYLTIKEILKKRIKTTDKEEKDRLKERALELSLQVLLLNQLCDEHNITLLPWGTWHVYSYTQNLPYLVSSYF